MGQFAAPRFAGSVMGFISLIQFLVAGVGMSGLLAYLTKLQTREIGIRIMRRLLPAFAGTAVYVFGLIAAITGIAGYLPIRRILADNPMAALRHE